MVPALPFTFEGRNFTFIVAIFFRLKINNQSHNTNYDLLMLWIKWINSFVFTITSKSPK